MEKPTKVRPLHARAAVKRIEAEDKTANGIIIARMPETNDTPA
jgi:co-chaperonin GroES (HSP10)